MKILKIIILIFLSFLFLFLGSIFVLQQLSKDIYPIGWGISFNQDHAEDLGMNWRQAYIFMLEDLKPKYIRIAAMWSEVEPVQDIFDYSDVDFMMNAAERNGVKVTLVIGQKSPRWPECHIPKWVNYENMESKDSLLKYIQTTVERYKNHPSLEIWQVENEPFIRFTFGECENYQENFVIDELALVKKLDPNHKIMVTDSGELSSWRKAVKAGDIFGTTVYRIVRRPRGGIWTYDWLPASFYRLKAKFLGIDLKNMYVSELQAEPWFTSIDPQDTSLAIQEETMNVQRLQNHLQYASQIGVKRAYLWGVEWWYWMKQKNKDDRYWNIIKNTLHK